MLHHYKGRLLYISKPQMAFGQEHIVQCIMMHQKAASEAHIMTHQSNGMYGECEQSLWMDLHFVRIAALDRSRVHLECSIVTAWSS